MHASSVCAKLPCDTCDILAFILAFDTGHWI